MKTKQSTISFRTHRVILLFLFMLAIVFHLGAGSSIPPIADSLNIISHGLSLPPGFDLPKIEAASMPKISTDYQNHFPNPKSFEHPKDILSKGMLPKNRLVSFLFLHNPKLDVLEVEKIADLYIKESAIEGVNHDIAFIQMCLETGFLKFNGDVRRSQNNFCGLGAIGNGAPGMSFATTEIGIRAHIQHLKAYASKDKINRELVDGRHEIVKKGSAMNIHDLTGKWAVDPLYGKKLDYLLAKIYDGAQLLKPKTSILFD